MFDNLENCINFTLEKASEYACEGVTNNIGGPFGAAIIQKVDNKYKLLTLERNTVVSTNDVTAHAEINAIRKASIILQRFELSDCVLISTAKSCPMCLSAACWSKIPTIYYSQDYESATTSGFKDNAIFEYFQGKNNLIEEIQFENSSCLTPFKLWNEKEDRTNY